MPNIKNNKGQTLIVAVIIMFLLAVLSGVFIALVARNLGRATRSTSSDAVLEIAKAGVEYANQMFMYGEEGADWRPIPDNNGTATLGNLYALPSPIRPIADLTMSGDGVNPNWLYMRNKYPDFKWTRAYWPIEIFPNAYTPVPGEMGFAGPSGGYKLYKSGQGRFLLRIGYDPNPNQPMSKLLKIESIGRLGPGIIYVGNEPDPTTMLPNGNPRLKREITAFKPIGITDYMRFITNKGKRSNDFALGCAGFDIIQGRDNSSRYGYRTAPIRVNGNVKWYGNALDIYTKAAPEQDTAGILPIDPVEIAGDISFENQIPAVMHVLDKTGTEIGNDNILPSDDNNFTTLGGVLRDGRETVDVDSNARGIKRLEPPLLDVNDIADANTRYRNLTLNSGRRVLDNGRTVNTGATGWGRGIYINNPNDTQNESETLFGGYTLRADWLNPNNRFSNYWQGPYYTPPGVLITLNPGDTDGDNQPDITITRTDVTSRGRAEMWRDASGRARPDWGSTVTMPYPDPTFGRDLGPKYGVNPAIHVDGNGVIFAEGNIRIRGMLPPAMQLTVVSNENIYIEGSLLKYRDTAVDPDSTDKYRGADQSCGLALLAQNSVCVNTTQFFAPRNTISADDIGSDAQNGEPPYHIIVGNEPSNHPRFLFNIGPYESETAATPTAWMMILRHAGQYGPAYVDTWMNQTSLPLNNVYLALPEYLWGVGDSNYKSKYGQGYGQETKFAGDIFDISTFLILDSAITNFFEVVLDQTYFTRNNYLLGGFAIQPMDVRIEAIMYAQEGSFFVIPGQWFNPDPLDVPGAVRLAGSDPEFPYYGDPLDVRIIIDGTIAENTPASSSDVEAWMQKWGKIPDTYGSSGTATAHAGEGFTVLYDEHAGFPLAFSNTNASFPDGLPVRIDAYGRILPLAPRLPVCSSIIYSGDTL